MNWFLSKGYVQGVFWAIMICLVSVSNDVLMCSLGKRLHVIEISFFRFFFSLLSVIPVMIWQGGCAYFKTQALGQNLTRALVGATALGLCCYSVNIMPLSENTAVMFAEPLFFLPLAFFLLKEKVDMPRWIATGMGFTGLMVILQPGSDAFQVTAFIPMAAAFLFALLNIMAKKMISKEHSLTLLFYFGLGTTAIASVVVPFFWQTPTLNELFFLACLGIGGNMIQVCLFKAFSATDASSLMPFRYVEFLFSALSGFLFFGQIPTPWILAGAALIIASTFYISHVETRKEKRNLQMA